VTDPLCHTTTDNAHSQQILFGTDTLTYDLNGNLATVTDYVVSVHFDSSGKIDGISMES